MLPSTSPLPATSVGDETDHQNAPQSNINHNQQSPKMTSAYNGRRKSSLSYQQQLQLVTAVGVDGIIGGSGNSLSDYGGSCSSPNHFNQHTNESFMHHHHAKLSIHPMDRYDDTLTCCLPPPSPAPTCDRYVMGMPSPSPTPVTASSSNQNCFSNFEPAAASAVLPTNQQSLASPSSNSIVSNVSSSNGNMKDVSQHQSAATNSAGLIMSQKFSSANSVSTLQRSLSPNSRFRISDRFRENPNSSSAASSSSRYACSTHFLSQHSPLVPSDAYSYLSSAVHTPVKRYVPTPPPPTEIYTDMPISLQQQQPLPPAAASSKSSTVQQQLPHSAQLQQQQQQPHQHSTNIINTMPYRFRMKCCSNETPPQQQQQQQGSNSPLPNTQVHYHDHRSSSIAAVDYYATSPHTRLSYKCSSNSNSSGSNSSSCSAKESQSIMLHEQQVSNTQPKSCSSSAASSSIFLSNSLTSPSGASTTVSPVTVGGGTGVCARQVASMRTSTNCMGNEFVSRTPSIEYINTSLATNSSGIIGRVITPMNALSGLDGITNTSTSNGTCLHCNTMRRTTGVHQTTQTTGPISPVPLQQMNSNGTYSKSVHNNQELTSSTSTPSTSESHISPLSPAASIQTQKHQQQQQKIEQEKDETVDQDQGYQQQQLYHQQYQQQQQQQQQRQPHRQIVTTQNNLLDHNNIISGQHAQHVENRVQQQQHYHKQSPQQLQQLHQSLPLQQQLQQRYSRKQRISQYLCKEIAKFFGVDIQTETEERAIWYGRQRRLALRRFGVLHLDSGINATINDGGIGNVNYHNDSGVRSHRRMHVGQNSSHHSHQHSERPDILPVQDTESSDMQHNGLKNANNRRHHYINTDFQLGDHVERKASVPSMFLAGLTYIIQTLNKRQTRQCRQCSRSFAPAHITTMNNGENDICEGLTILQEEEVFFDSPGNEQNCVIGGMASVTSSTSISPANGVRNVASSNAKIIEHQRQLYMGERVHGWRTSAIIGNVSTAEAPLASMQQQQHLAAASVQQQSNQQQHQPSQHQQTGIRGHRIASQILDGVLENSRRPLAKRVKLFSINDLDDRHDHRPFFTYWINTVQILVLFLSLICYGIGPIGFGVEQKTGQVLVTSLSLQTVQHQEQRNVWIGPRNSDLVHMGAKFATCMRRDVKIMDVLVKTRRQERETACCIRNDDSGCVQSSQADCSVRGLFPTKSISTWKKWSPGESGPGGRISGSVCGLDPKYCDAPASIAPYEWPDDITKWPICRKTNSFSQRFRYKDHTAEHMVCEVIGHPCCTGVFGECRITTREYCDFVKGYFHEEASLCSQISCLNNVCGMFPFFSIEVPDQFYRLFTSLCLHAGILHLAITVVFQHVFLSDLERLIGPMRTAIVYIGSGLAGNLTSAVLVPYKSEVGPLASLSGVVASLVVLLILMHWKQLHKPHVALFKLIFIGGLLFGIGTLPWQLNFAGLLAGIFCGIFLTIALVPFVSVTKYGRKAKIHLIWSCILFHLFIYTVMLMVFYLFPTELTNFNFGEVFSGGPKSNFADLDSMGRIESFSNNVMTSSSNKHRQQQQQYHHHHHSDDIIGNNVLNGGGGGGNSAAHMLQSSSKSQMFFNHNYHSSRTTSSNSNFPNNNNNLYESSNHNFNNNNNKNINNSNSKTGSTNFHSARNSIVIFNNNSNNIGNYNEMNNIKKTSKNNYNLPKSIKSQNYYNINSKSNLRHMSSINSNSNNFNNSNMTTSMQQHAINNNSNQQQTININNFNANSNGLTKMHSSGDNIQPSIAAIRGQPEFVLTSDKNAAKKVQGMQQLWPDSDETENKNSTMLEV